MLTVETSRQRACQSYGRVDIAVPPEGETGHRMPEEMWNRLRSQGLICDGDDDDDDD